MHSAHYHPLQMPFMIGNPVNEQAYAGEGDQERNRRNEHPLARPVGNRGADQVAEPRQLKQHQQHDHNQANEREQESSASFRHTLS